MSFKTWKQEFYPTSAKSKKAAQNPVKHSLLKWTGLLEENLKKHGCIIKDVCVQDLTNHLWIGSETCALCVLHLMKSRSCKKCPLYIELGKRCDDSFSGPYQQFVSKDDPQPMVAVLKRVLKKTK